MELSVEEFIDGLLTKEAEETPSDTVKPEQINMELPPWFDLEEHNKARRFYWDNCFSFSISMMLGLCAVFAVPSILRILVASRRSSSVYTSYRRYVSTFLHIASWFEHELKPGSRSWKSLYAVRTRHARAGLVAQLQGNGVVSQRDIALTQFGFIGFVLLKPDKFGIRQLTEGDWEAYNHFWRVLGYMIGLEDRYNICRKTVEETRQVCQILLERVYSPCLENVPEYFEHMARVMLDGMWSINPVFNTSATLFWCRYLADVPGYIYTEGDRITFYRRLKEQLKGKPLDTGVESTSLISKSALEGLPNRPPRLLYLRDFETFDTVPVYREMNFAEKYNLNMGALVMFLYSTYFGRLYCNLWYRLNVLLMKYLPYIAFFRFGVRASYVNIFSEDPTDNTKPKPNSEFYKPKPPVPWYRSLLSILR